jgi:hypothetical protein
MWIVGHGFFAVYFVVKRNNKRESGTGFVG